MILIGSNVNPPGTPAKFLPFNIAFLIIVLEILFVIIFTKIFRKISSSTIGRVLIILHSQSVGFGIGNSKACFQSPGTIPVSRHQLYKISKCSLNFLYECFTISYAMVLTPAAFPLGQLFSTVSNSSNVILFKSLL